MLVVHVELLNEKTPPRDTMLNCGSFIHKLLEGFL